MYGMKGVVPAFGFWTASPLDAELQVALGYKYMYKSSSVGVDHEACNCAALLSVVVHGC